MGVRGAHTFPSRNRLPYPFSLVVRPLFCFVVCWHSLPFQDKYVSGDSVNFRGSFYKKYISYGRRVTNTYGSRANNLALLIFSKLDFSTRLMHQALEHRPSSRHVSRAPRVQVP